MTKQIISTPNAPSSSLYSQGIRVGSTIYVSGMIGIDQTTSELAGPTVQEQTRQAVRNCVAVLEAGGGIRGDIVPITVLLTNPSDFTGMNEAYADEFPTQQPTRAVTKLGVELPGVLVSIMMTAQLGD